MTTIGPITQFLTTNAISGLQKLSGKLLGTSNVLGSKNTKEVLGGIESQLTPLVKDIFQIAMKEPVVQTVIEEAKPHVIQAVVVAKAQRAIASIIGQKAVIDIIQQQVKSTVGNVAKVYQKHEKGLSEAFDRLIETPQSEALLKALEGIVENQQLKGVLENIKNVFIKQ